MTIGCRFPTSSATPSRYEVSTLPTTFFSRVAGAHDFLAERSYRGSGRRGGYPPWVLGYLYHALTELKYARSKWAHPKDRVVPAILRPTPWSEIPNYLKSVTVLEPEGNVAA